MREMVRGILSPLRGEGSVQSMRFDRAGVSVVIEAGLVPRQEQCRAPHSRSTGHFGIVFSSRPVKTVASPIPITDARNRWPTGVPGLKRKTHDIENDFGSRGWSLQHQTGNAGF
jgi:hypothetical protein